MNGDPLPPIWGNKGLGFITWLGAFLLRAQPESILELGGGRTTRTLYDYAFRFQRRIATIEQSAWWMDKLCTDLLCLKIEDPAYLASIHYVPLQGSEDDPSGWYDLDAFDQVVSGHKWDVVFVDGPAGACRQNGPGQARVMRAADTARMILVDDVDQPDNLDLFWRMTDGRFAPSHRFLYPYADRQHVLALAVTKPWARIARNMFTFLRLEHWPCCTRL